MHLGAGSVGELFGNIAAFQSCDHVKPVRGDNSCHLFDGYVGIAAQVRNVAGVVLVGKNQAHHVSMFLQGLAGASNPRLKFFNRCGVPAIDGWRVLQHS